MARPDESQPDHEVIVVGAGFSGIGVATELDRAGMGTVLLEEGDGFGGTWYWNRYPGIAVDIPSFSYQYSFAQEHDWSRSLRARRRAARVRATLRRRPRPARADPVRHADRKRRFRRSRGRLAARDRRR